MVDLIPNMPIQRQEADNRLDYMADWRDLFLILDWVMAASVAASLLTFLRCVLDWFVSAYHRSFRSESFDRRNLDISYQRPHTVFDPDGMQ